jgi:hypothetical protein
MYAAETNGDQHKIAIEEGISDEVAQKVLQHTFYHFYFFLPSRINQPVSL